MSDNEFISTTADHTNHQVQTPENTMTPFEPAPTQPIAPTLPKKKKRIRLTPKQRAAKIAAGWNPPGPQPKKDEHTASLPSEPRVKRPSKGDIVLKSLVDKLVALENDTQFRAVWTHYFVHGGVYNGPRYVDELHDAIQYLIETENLK